MADVKVLTKSVELFSGVTMTTATARTSRFMTDDKTGQQLRQQTQLKKNLIHINATGTVILTRNDLSY
jgi:hypothetical protein